jgi:sugar/nucleoside kinase (ribokinase family)
MKRQLPLLTIIGDVGIDLVMGPIDSWPAIGTESLMNRSELRAGGSGGNTALAASYLGAESRLVSAIGNDALGTWLREQFSSLNASLSACSATTSVTVGFIHSCGERTFFTTRGHLEAFAYEHVRPLLHPTPNAGSIAMLCGAFLTPALRKSYPRLIGELVDLGYEVALDTGWPPDGWTDASRAEVAGWLRQCDHALLNELEVVSLADQPDLDAATARVASMLKPGATLVVKTGERGALGVQQGKRLEFGAEKLSVFDTIGAGDSFNAGYLLSRLSGGDLAASLAAGCQAAGSIISRFPRRQIRPGELAGQLSLTPAAAANAG